jgi:hypothetical protein
MSITEQILNDARHYQKRYQGFFSKWNLANYVLGTVSIVASASSAAIPETQRPYGVVLSVLAAVLTALITFLHAGDNAKKYLNAVSILDLVLIAAASPALQVDDAAVVDAIKRANEQLQ